MAPISPGFRRRCAPAPGSAAHSSSPICSLISAWKRMFASRCKPVAACITTCCVFGQKAVRRDSLTGRSDIGTGPLGLLGNLIWLLLAGWWLALAHMVTAIILAATIIGIPFAWAHVKLAGIALWPIGKVIVPA